MRTKVILLLIFGLTVLVAASLLRKFTTTSAARPQTPQGFMTAIQQGLGNGCSFSGSSGPSGAVNSVASFIEARSGLVLTQQIKVRLSELESKTMYGERARKTASEVSTAISDTWFERVGELTDNQIWEIGYHTRTAIDAPFSNGPGVMLRTSGQVTFSDMAGWMSKALAYRDGSTPEALNARSLTSLAIYSALDQRLQAYSDALPSQWNQQTGYTPAQAFLLAYSMVADDWLHQSGSGLTQSMKALENSISEAFPGCQTSSQDRRPYGYLGYLYSTHLPYLFNESVQNRLIDRL